MGYDDHFPQPPKGTKFKNSKQALEWFEKQVACKNKVMGWNEDRTIIDVRVRDHSQGDFYAYARTEENFKQLKSPGWVKLYSGFLGPYSRRTHDLYDFRRFFQYGGISASAVNDNFEFYAIFGGQKIYFTWRDTNFVHARASPRTDASYPPEAVAYDDDWGEPYYAAPACAYPPQAVAYDDDDGWEEPPAYVYAPEAAAYYRAEACARAPRRPAR